MPGSSLPSCQLCLPQEFLAASQDVTPDLGAEVTGGGIGWFFTHLLDASGFPARWHCGTWSAELGWLHIVSDSAIFMAYMAIPASLLCFVLRRRDVPMRGMFWLFAAFICSCGITHLLDASMFYYPAYRLLGLMKLVTAVVSMMTVVAIVRVLPVALGMQGRLRDQESELDLRKRAEAEVHELNKKLQDRNSTLTVRSKRIEQAMDLARIGVIRWQARTGVIEWEAGVRDAMRDEEGRQPVFTQWSDILDTPELTAMLGASMDSGRTGRPLALEVPLSRTISGKGRIRVSAAKEPGSDAENATMVGFARILDGTTVERRIG
jgi:hypothetical protein